MRTQILNDHFNIEADPGHNQSYGVSNITDGNMNASMSLLPTHTPPEIPKRVKLRGILTIKLLN